MRERNLAMYYTLIYATVLTFLWIIFKPFFQICLFSFILVMVIDAVASLLTRFFKLKRKKLATTMAMLLFFSILSWSSVEVVPKAFTQIADFYSLLAKVIREKAWQPYLTNQEGLLQLLNDLADSLVPYIDNLAGFILKWFAGTIPNFIVVTFFTILCGIYASFYAGSIFQFIPKLYPIRCRDIAEEFLNDLKISMRKFIGVLALNATIVGLGFGLLFTFLSSRYAPLIGLWAFITNFIPIVGVPIELIPILLFSITLGLDKLLWVFIFACAIHLFVFILFFEVTKSTMRVNPVLMIISIVLGGMIFGFAGVFIGAPMAAFATIFYRHFLQPRFESHEW
ncbi:AI-2E family transporter [Pseudothermotoga sp.]|nr:AI-2E family transporter [Pseudothermotoga sp.]MCX7813072.1 AI-2E family transporter [Pseudothermotoga sp.]MDW8140474.1 AI-2E family transporter [Pseudothermotoga sp.]